MSVGLLASGRFFVGFPSDVGWMSVEQSFTWRVFRGVSVGRLFGMVHLGVLLFGCPLGRCFLIVVLHHPGGEDEIS